MNAADRRPPKSAGQLCGLPALFIVLICCALPLCWIVGLIVLHPFVLSDVHLSSFRLDLLGRTIAYNLCAGLLATAMGLPAGLVLGRGRGWLCGALWLVVPTALFMPSLAFAYGWSELVRFAEPLLRPLGLTFFPASPSDIARCIWILAAWLWAVPACVIGLWLRRTDSSVEQQAALDGALFRVMFRQLLAPLLLSISAVTILATQEFSVYEPTGISVVATEVRMVFDTGAFSSLNNPIVGIVPLGGIASPDQQHRAAAAIATAMPLLLLTLLLAGVGAWSAGKMSGGDEVALATWPRALNAPRWAVVLTCFLLILNIILPIVTLFSRLRAHFSFIRIWDEFSPNVLGALIVGTISAAVGAAVVLSASVRWTRGLLAIAVIAFLIGGQILAIALIRMTNRPAFLWAYDSFALPAAAYVGRFGWIALAAARTTWSKPWRELREMASLDGAGPLRAAAAVVWPLAWPTLLAGCILLGALSLTEVPATVLLSPQNPQVLTPMLMTWVHSAHYDPMIEASLLMVMLVLIPAASAVLLILSARRLIFRRDR